MIPIISLVTSVKDYIEVVHKLIESDSNYTISNYNELGSIITYGLISFKNSATDFLSLNWLKTLSNLPVMVPEISSAMISEISVLDGYFHNTFQFLDTPLSYGPKNGLIYGLEKFVIGLINSCFFIIPTSTAHLITLRRFVMQGLEAGYIAGVGTIAGNIFWTASIILGCRFFVIPWLSLDIFRYLLGFMLLIKYMWDSYNERRMVLEDLSKQKIFLLNFLLALTEQTSIYPFITNLSIGPESSILESFPVENYPQFLWVHLCYLGGLLVGSFSLLHLTCWFWENPAFQLYMWVISSFKVSTSFYSKFLNFGFLYLTMICAITSVPYYGLDYTLMNPLGFVSDDRIIDGKLLPETAFINSKASDKNTRRNRGRHGRRERWKRRVRKYRTFDASLYDQGVYDLFTIEDLNYGFDRFWLRRKMRNHRVRFRFFPGPWMRSFKKQLSKPRLESYAGPRQEFFRILFEQVYHPSFHKYNYGNKKDEKKLLTNNQNSLQTSFLNPPNLYKKDVSIYSSKFINNTQKSTFESLSLIGDKGSNLSGLNSLYENKNLDSFIIQKNLKQENSTLRKFVRKVNNRMKTSEILQSLNNSNNSLSEDFNKENKTIYSKRWKEIFSKIQKKDKKFFIPRNLSNIENGHLNGFLTNFYTNTLSIKPTLSSNGYIEFSETKNFKFEEIPNIKKENSVISNEKNLQILRYKSLLIPKMNSLDNDKSKSVINSPLSLEGKENEQQFNGLKEVSPNILLHPLNFYLKKEQAFQTKLNYYTPTVFRQFSIENNAPYFRVMMKRYFYYYKPTLRWKKTMKVASLRKARRKSSRVPRKLQFQYNESKTSLSSSNSNSNLVKSDNSSIGFETMPKLRESIPIGFEERLRKPTSTYTVVGKRASRYRYQIYKDVLQHWYYSPFNRFLLKLDVDSFIRRQPNFHFLTKNEENLIHLRRFLLSEHYNTLRWYTYMQHYRSMKTRIGGTKSFSSSVYNQQFQGTFKKIRHLFAITPSGLSTLENGVEVAPKTVFKFDQPLYNESFNTRNKQYLNTFLIHEELLDSSLSPSDSLLLNKEANKPLDDLVGQSTGIVRQYLVNAVPIRQQIIQDLISKRNYTELTQFLYTGQKTRGTQPILNNRELFNQEKNYLLTANEKEQIEKLEKEQLSLYLRDHNLKGDLWVNLLKKWKRRVNDQEFMKNYISRRVEKREKREQKKQVLLEKKLAKLTSWLNGVFSPLELQSNNAKANSSLFNSNLKDKEGLTLLSGTQKAINDGIYSLEKLPTSNGRSLLTERSFSKASTLLKYKQKLLIRGEGQAKSNLISNSPISLTKMNFENLRFYSQLRKEKEIQTSLTSISNILQKMKDQKGLSSKTSMASLLNKGQKSIPSGKKYLKSLLTKTTNLCVLFEKNLEQYLGLKKVYSLFLPIQRKSLKNWRKKERALNKQKKSRKEFQNLSSIIKKKKAIRFQNEYYFSSPIVNEQIIEDANISSNTFLALRKKRDNSLEQENKEILSQQSVKTKLNNSIWGSQYSSNDSFLTKQFKRKKSPQRRARIRRNRGVTRKRTLADSLKREFRNLRRYGEKVDNDRKKQQILEKINNYSLIGSKEQSQRTYVPSDNFNLTGQKQRRSKQRKQRTWKQKRSKYSQKLRKYKKRRRNVLGKIRILSKQLKRVQSKVQIQNWWWKNFLPSIRANSDALWQIEKDRQIREKLQEFSVSEILKRDSINTSVGELQIGNRDFKPLALPQAIRLKESLFTNTNSLSKDLDINSLSKTSQDQMSNFYQDLPGSIQNNNTIRKNDSGKENQDLIAKLYENLLITNPNKDLSEQSSFLTNNTSIPFYAGWDESLRKFVVTNRLLSRRQTGFQLQLKNSSFKDSTIPGLNPLLVEKETKENLQNDGTSLSSLTRKTVEKNNEHIFEFTSAPLKGMNAATTLYWQIPFTTYDPDQFFALGMDGFAPIGWKRFNFRHTILKSWLYYLSSTQSVLTTNSSPVQENSLNNEKKAILVKKETTLNSGFTVSSTSYNGEVNKERNPLIYKLNRKERSLASSDQSKFSSIPNLSELDVTSKKMKKNLSRRLKKRNRRVKKHPRAPVWFPSGPLLNQVLPVHYIYVFYKRSRVPRDRYIKRRLQNIKSDNKKILINREPTNGPLSPALIDYTLRKRVKTKRKYHRKKDLSKKMPIFPRRVKFLGEDIDSIHWRPMSRQKLNKPIAEIVREQRLLRNKQRKKESNANNKQPSLRVKQLRRRVQRQIIRTVWRYKPRAGGFVWPGDYLRLELVKAPKLQQLSVLAPNTLLDQEKQELNSKEKRKTKRKKKRAVQEWQIQPKKYLLEKHNLRVIKKKLEKANRSSKMKQRIKELNYLI